MNATHLSESLKMDATCLLCMDCLTDPGMGKYGHAFCKECLLSQGKEAPTPGTCPNCKVIISWGDSLYNGRLQHLAPLGKMFGQSIRDLNTCDQHGEEVTLFCEQDQRALCVACFVSPEHKDHGALPLDVAVGQCLQKLQTSWKLLQRQEQKFQMELECETMREARWEGEGQTLKDLVVSEYEKMHQFFWEEEELQLKKLDKEGNDTLILKEIKDNQSQEIFSMQRNSEKTPVEMFILKDQTVKQAMKAEFEKKHEILSEEKQLHLQRMDQEFKEFLGKLEEDKAKMIQQICRLQVGMLEIEKTWKKLPIEMLQDAKDTLERTEELLLDHPVVRSPRWTMFPIPGMPEMLLTFHRDLSLDPKTANPHLLLSDDFKSVEYVSVPQAVPNNPERFNFALWVLATQSFTSGKHYWEVEVGNKTEWEVGICKASIRRKGSGRKSPGDTSTLVAFPFGNDFCLWYSHHNINVQKPIPKVGIFLDYERGHIAFYNAVDGSLIYSPPNGAFHGPLFPCFSPCFPKGKNTSGFLRICPGKN